MFWRRSYFNFFTSDLLHNSAKNNRNICNILWSILFIAMHLYLFQKFLVLNFHQLLIIIFIIALIVHNNNEPMVVTNKTFRVKSSLPIVCAICFKIFVTLETQIENKLRHIYFTRECYKVLKIFIYGTSCPAATAFSLINIQITFYIIYCQSF